MTKANNSAAMKEGNKRLIVNIIRKNPQSRADIARRTGLSRAAVTILTDSLIEEGIILNGETVKSDSGRHPTLLQLNPGAFVSVGVDISREGCEILLTDFLGNKLYEKRIDILKTANQTVEAVCDLINLGLSEVSGGTEVIGICVCCPGPIDSERGVILNPSELEIFHGYGIVEALTSHFSLPIYLEKDTNALAIAETNCGDVSTDMLFLLADHGIGCAIIKEGRLFMARDGMGGELGHTTVDINGPICHCGNVGCAELYASIPAAVMKSGAGCWENLIKSAKSGDVKAVEALKEQGNVLAVLCVNAANLFEPKDIVLGGRLADADFILNDIIEMTLNRSAFSRNVHGFRVLTSRLGQNARAYAAAVTAIEHYFKEGNHL